MKLDVIQGDCRDVMSQLPPSKFDGIVTDPPYSSGGAMRGDRMASSRTKYVQSNAQHAIAGFTGDNRDQRGYLAWCSLWMAEARHLTVPGGIIAVFTDWRQLPITTDAIQAAGWVWRGIAVWGKKTGRPCKGRYASQAEFVVWGTNGPREMEGPCGRGLWVANTPMGDDRQHITQKPVEVMSGLLKIFGDDATILDPFCGSGSTGVACAQAGLNFTGIELDPEYSSLARQRIQAEREKSGLFL